MKYSPLICPKCGGMMKIVAFMARGHPVYEGEAVREITVDDGRKVQGCFAEGG